MRETVMTLAMKGYSMLLPFSWAALAIVVLLLLPMSLFTSMRRAAGLGMIIASHLFGLTVWMLGAAISFGTFGWIGLLLGLLVFGIGVVPLSITGAVFKLHHGLLAFWLFGMTATTLATRCWGRLLARTAMDR